MNMLNKIILAGLTTVSLVCVSWAGAANEQIPQRVAVVPFNLESADPNDVYLTHALPWALSSALSLCPDLAVEARRNIREAMENLEVINSTSVFEAARVGVYLGDVWVLVGNIKRGRFGLQIKVDLVDAQSGKKIIERSLPLVRNSQLLKTVKFMCREMAGKLSGSPVSSDLLTSFPSSEEAFRYYALGQEELSYGQLNHLTQAEKYFRAALAIYPQFGLAYAGLANTFLFRGTLSRDVGLDYSGFMDRALEYSEVSLKLSADSPECLSVSAHALMQSGKPKDKEFAKELIARAIRIKPNEYFYYYIQWRLQGSSIEDPLMDKILRLNPKFAALYFERGMAFLSKNQTDVALKSMLKAIALDPGNALYHVYLGVVYLKKIAPDDALRCFVRAAQLDSNLPAAFLNMGIVYMQQDKLTDAETTIKKAIQLNSNYAPAHFNLGLVYGRMNKPENAIDEFKFCVNIDSGNSMAHVLLAQEYLKIKERRP